MNAPTASAPVAGTAPARAAGPGAWVSLTVVSLGLFLAVVSTTVVSVALPTLGRDLRAGATGLEWVVDAYVIVYASLLVPGGALGDRLGRKGPFLTGVALFAAGSLAAGLAPSAGVLLAGRVLQGVGPALLVPGSLTIIRAVFADSRQRAMAIGLWSMSSGVALAVGPPLGGLLVAGLGWRAVFLFNVPLATALITAGARYLPRLPRVPARGRFDWPAAALITAAVALLAVGVIEGQAHGWTAGPVLAAFTAGAGALAGFAAVEIKRAEPLIDLSLFRNYPFSVANAAAFVVFFAFVGAIVYFSAYFQQAQGHSAITAGLDVAVIGVAYAVASNISGRLVGHAGERWPMFAGLVVAGVAMLGLLRLRPGTGIGAIWWNFAVLGAGIGLCGTPMSTTAMSSVGPDRAGMASAVVNALRQVGQVFGVAVLGALIYARLPGASGTGRPLAPAQQALFVTGLHHALWVCALALLAAAVPVTALAARAGPPKAGPPKAGPPKAGSAPTARQQEAKHEKASQEPGKGEATMASDPGTIAETYIRAWKERDFGILRSILADDVVFEGPLARLDNADDCVEGLRKMSQIVTDIVVRKRLADGTDAITWFDLHTSVAPPVPTANWSHVEDGKIIHIRVAFDARRLAPPPGR